MTNLDHVLAVLEGQCGRIGGERSCRKLVPVPIAHIDDGLAVDLAIALLMEDDGRGTACPWNWCCQRLRLASERVRTDFLPTPWTSAATVAARLDLLSPSRFFAISLANADRRPPVCVQCGQTVGSWQLGHSSRWWTCCRTNQQARVNHVQVVRQRLEKSNTTTAILNKLAHSDLQRLEVSDPTTMLMARYLGLSVVELTGQLGREH